MRKEQFGENEPGDGAVEEEVVPLDRGPDGGSDDGAAKLDLMFGGAEGGGLGIGCHARLFSGGVPQKPCDLPGKETCDLTSGLRTPGQEPQKNPAHSPPFGARTRGSIACAIVLPSVKHVTPAFRVRRY
jgi:hypothetical protein